jgi:DNA-binding Xre family transcriptional regulator
MNQGFSRLKFLLEERQLSRADLRRQIAARDQKVNPKTLTRLADPNLPLERIDLRVAAAICDELGVGLGDLIVFADRSGPVLESLSEEKQLRLDDLMERHNEGLLSLDELAELRRMVSEAMELSNQNARRMAGHLRRLREITPDDRAAS